MLRAHTHTYTHTHTHTHAETQRIRSTYVAMFIFTSAMQACLVSEVRAWWLALDPLPLSGDWGRWRGVSVTSSCRCANSIFICRFVELSMK